MKRHEFPGSRENVGKLVQKYGAIGKPTTAERRILEQYLAGCVSSNTHSRDVLFNMVQIRHLLGYGLPHELIPQAPTPKSAKEIAIIKSRLMDIARLLFRADMKNPSNIELRDEAKRLLDGLPRGESEEAYSDACFAHARMEYELGVAEGEPASGKALRPQEQPIPGLPMVIIDSALITEALGREPTEHENEAIALRADAMACGRSEAFAVAACEVFGRGRIPDEVKRLLGIMR